MEEEILIPLGMVLASFEWREDFITPVPNGHNLKGEPNPVYVYSEKGAGGLFANAEDIALFVSSAMVNEFYSGENILSEENIRELYTLVIEVADIYSHVSEHYGLGHFIEAKINMDAKNHPARYFPLIGWIAGGAADEKLIISRFIASLFKAT